MFQQGHSWGRFKFTKDICQRILGFHNVFLPFLDCIHAFGLKSGEDTRIWDGFYATNSATPELCYVLRYFENNGRGSGNPWSLRQTGIYQKYAPDSGKSIWILVQPSDAFSSQLHKILLHDSTFQGRGSFDPMQLHSVCLSLSLDNFGEYIENLQSDITQMNFKACFSTVGKPKLHDFPVAFKGIQRLQLTRQKLLRVANVLQSLSGIAGRLQAHCQLLESFTGEKSQTGDSQDLGICKNRIEVYSRRVEMALTFSAETGSLLSKILDSRHDEVLLKTSTAMQASLEVLKQIAFVSGEENRNLSKISAQNQADSHTLKALTTIATMYLPASLIATLFTSSLVQIQPQIQTQGNNGHFTVAREFWIYILATVLLTAVTLGLVVLLQKPWRLSVSSTGVP